MRRLRLAQYCYDGYHRRVSYQQESITEPFAVRNWWFQFRPSHKTKGISQMDSLLALLSRQPSMLTIDSMGTKINLTRSLAARGETPTF